MRIFPEFPAVALNACDAFARLSPPLLEQISRSASMQRYGTGDHLWHTGEVVEHLFIIQSGAVEIVQHSAHGESSIMGLFGAGDLLCFSAALQRRPYPADAVAIAPDTDALRLPLGPIIDAQAASAELSAAINDALVQHTAVLRAKAGIVSAGSVPRRLAAFMLYLIERFGTEEQPPEVTIGIALTREQIGQFVGARVETVIRILGRWQKAGWMQTSSARIRILRRDMLERVLAH
jgi:CRP-like cAMP-binding protein